MKKFLKYISVMTVAISVLGIQFGSVTAAHADTNADLSMNAHMNFANTGLEVQVCNQGPSTVTSFVLDIDASGFVIDQGLVSQFASAPATDIGTFDLGTMTWTGQVDYVPFVQDVSTNQCIDLGFTGHAGVAVGETASITASIVSSVLSDTSVNVDPDTNNDVIDVTPFVVALPPDISLDTRLATTGAIAADTTVTYEATISNVGAGAYHDSGFMLVGFIIPEGSTFVSVTDPDNADALSLVDSNPDPDLLCFSPGTADDMGLTALDAYHGVIQVCMLQTSEDLAPGSVYPLEFNILAGAGLAAGTAEVVGLFEGNDPDTLDTQLLLVSGIDPFVANTANNNVVHLSYDPDALQATADRCEGQGETTSDGTGCFTITFNKKIFAGSFDASDIDLQTDVAGDPVVTDFTQLDDFTWQVEVSDIPVGGTLTFLLDLGGLIQDYSAVLNTTQVLGINTIRYEAPAAPAPDASGNESTSGSVSGSTSANGTLAATGLHKPDYSTPALLIGLGLLMVALSRRRKVAAAVTK